MGINENDFRPYSAANQVICRERTADPSTDERNGFIQLHGSNVVHTKPIENFQIVIAYKET